MLGDPRRGHAMASRSVMRMSLQAAPVSSAQARLHSRPMSRYLQLAANGLHPAETVLEPFQNRMLIS